MFASNVQSARTGRFASQAPGTVTRTQLRRAQRGQSARAEREQEAGVVQDDQGNTPSDAIDDTLVGRVDDLRGKEGYLTKGTGNLVGALLWPACCQLTRVAVRVLLSRKFVLSTVPAADNTAASHLHASWHPFGLSQLAGGSQQMLEVWCTQLGVVSPWVSWHRTSGRCRRCTAWCTALVVWQHRTITSCVLVLRDQDILFKSVDIVCCGCSVGSKNVYSLALHIVVDNCAHAFSRASSDAKCRCAELMKFSGPAPELINGRLAMWGFFAAVGAELATHETVASQLKNSPLLILAFSTLIAVASIIPMVRGTKWLDDGFGDNYKQGFAGVRFGFNVTNELITGRAAMFGMALLLIYEAGAKQAMF